MIVAFLILATIAGTLYLFRCFIKSVNLDDALVDYDEKEYYEIAALDSIDHAVQPLAKVGMVGLAVHEVNGGQFKYLRFQERVCTDCRATRNNYIGVFHNTQLKKVQP